MQPTWQAGWHQSWQGALSAPSTVSRCQRHSAAGSPISSSQASCRSWFGPPEPPGGQAMNHQCRESLWWLKVLLMPGNMTDTLQASLNEMDATGMLLSIKTCLTKTLQCKYLRKRHPSITKLFQVHKKHFFLDGLGRRQVNPVSGCRKLIT